MPVFDESVAREKFNSHIVSGDFKMLKWHFINRKRYYKIVARVWYEEFTVADDARKLLFIQFAQDIIEAARKTEATQMADEFTVYLFKAFEYLEKNNELISDMKTIFNKCQSQGLYNPEIIAMSLASVSLS